MNVTDCMHTIEELGRTEFHNICDGTVRSLAWGTGDWIAFYAVVAMIALVITIGIVVVVIAWKDI